MQKYAPPEFLGALFLSGSPRSRKASWGDCFRGPREAARFLGVIVVGVPEKPQGFLG